MSDKKDCKPKTTFDNGNKPTLKPVKRRDKEGCK